MTKNYNKLIINDILQIKYNKKFCKVSLQIYYLNHIKNVGKIQLFC